MRVARITLVAFAIASVATAIVACGSFGGTSTTNESDATANDASALDATAVDATAIDATANLLQNPSFANGCAFWTGSSAGGSSTSSTIGNGDSTACEFCAPPNSFFDQDVTLTLNPNDAFTASIYVRAAPSDDAGDDSGIAAAPGVSFGIDVLDSKGDVLQQGSIGQALALGTSWQQISSGIKVLPEGGAGLSVAIAFGASSSPLQCILVDDAVLQRN